MKSRLKLLHPATMFFLLTVAVVFLSWIFDIYGLSVSNPATGEEIRVQSLLSPEGIRWSLRHVVTNFTGFAPLGMVMVALFGVGVAEHSGFIRACIRRGLQGRMNRRFVMLSVIFSGVLSNVVGDAGYIILVPIAAMLFQAVGLHPLAGIITAYVSVACGYSANVFLSTMDPLLARYTQEAAVASGLNSGNTGALSNYYFMFVSAFLVTFIIYRQSNRLSARLGAYEGGMHFDVYKQLSRKERRALLLALSAGAVYAGIIAFATFSPWGILRGVTGGMTRSPFIAGALFLISFGFGLMGMVYGFASGRYRSDADVIKGLSQPMSLLAVYFVIAFFAAQMFACFEYSRLDKCLAIGGADLLSSTRTGGAGMLLLFIVLSAAVNLIMVSSTAKWSFMAFTFIPMFAATGVGPDWVQCAYRVGDSATNALTPFMFYMPLVLAYMQRYDRESTYATLLRYTWRYSLWIFAGWTLLFALWYLAGLPPGI